MQIEDSSKANYWKNKVKGTSNDLNGFLKQVARTYLGEPISESEFKIIVNSIIKVLNITNKDEILDLGCANGLITNQIAKYANFVTGFDINQDLLTVANEHHKKDNIDYILSNVMDIDFTQYNAKKFYMLAVAQYLEYKMLRKLLQKISNQKESFILFITEIPDQEKLLSFYDTKERRNFLFTEIIENKKSHIGNWWYKEHIIQMCESLGLSIEIQDKKTDLDTSHYWFDVLISK